MRRSRGIVDLLRLTHDRLIDASEAMSRAEEDVLIVTGAEPEQAERIIADRAGRPVRPAVFLGDAGLTRWALERRRRKAPGLELATLGRVSIASLTLVVRTGTLS